LPPNRTLVLVFVVVVLVLFPSSSVSTFSSISASGQQTNSLADHWVPSWNCFRDELNPSDQDYNNCWMDNAGKILISSEFTGDATDAARSLDFIESYLSSSGNYYLPELKVNSTSPLAVSNSPDTLSNNIIELSGNNSSPTHYDQLAIGASYTGQINLGYLGADRACFHFGSSCNITASISSQVFEIPNGFSKRSLFEFQSSMYYLYLNATIAQSNPFANVSIQMEPLNSSSPGVEYVYLQAFNSTIANPFYGGDLYNQNGSFNQTIPFRNSGPLNQGGYLLSYSNATNVFTSVNNARVTGQDAVAIKFSNQGIYSWEHWANDYTGYNRSWFGLGFNVEQNVTAGSLSKPIYAQVYPILDFDYHLANDTIHYIATTSDPNIAVSPPVDFGAISYGLALAANKSAGNATLDALAKGYWNYYYDRYNQSATYTPYARSINLLSLAGFKLYGCNSTVENFTRRFLGKTSGGAIEEFGWGVAALYQLKNCTGKSTDIQLYQSFVNAFGTSNSHYILLDYNGTTDLNPTETFHFGEAAAGLMLGGVPYNDPVVLGAMSAVYQSNQTGVVQIEPYVRDLANTETLPAYLLSTFLFQGEMRNETGYWITSISNANVTSIDYSNGTLLIGVKANDNGSISIASNSGVRAFPVDGYSVLNIQKGTAPNDSTFRLDVIYVMIGVIVVLSVSLAFLVWTRKRRN
jgi:hypothetical protein